jgi:hypothetical protein
VRVGVGVRGRVRVGVGVRGRVRVGVGVRGRVRVGVGVRGRVLTRKGDRSLGLSIVPPSGGRIQDAFAALRRRLRKASAGCFAILDTSSARWRRGFALARGARGRRRTNPMLRICAPGQAWVRRK